MKLGVAVQPDPYFEIIPIRVEIIDVNDNWPLFPARVVSHQILESAAPGTSLVVPVADDPDSPMFSVKEYTMQVCVQSILRVRFSSFFEIVTNL